LSEICTVRSAFVYVPVFSPHIDAGSTTSASCAVSVRKASLTTRNRRFWVRIERIRCSSGSETAAFVAVVQRKRIEPSSAKRKICIACVGGAQCGIVSGSTFQSAASSSTCASFSKLRKAGRAPFAPVSRVFSAVGWPFIWKTAQPGLPIMPRSRLTLFSCTAAAVAWFDWYTPCRHVETSRSPLPMTRAAARIASADTPQISAARSGAY
jgi:hypothetical protein